MAGASWRVPLATLRPVSNSNQSETIQAEIRALQRAIAEPVEGTDLYCSQYRGVLSGRIDALLRTQATEGNPGGAV